MKITMGEFTGLTRGTTYDFRGHIWDGFRIGLADHLWARLGLHPEGTIHPVLDRGLVDVGEKRRCGR